MLTTIQKTNNPMMMQMLQQMATMQSQLANLTLSATNTPRTRGLGLGTNTSTVNPRTGKPWRRYCWSCGCCTHWSKNCPQKKSGHKDDATFRNRMAGSNANCL